MTWLLIGAPEEINRAAPRDFAYPSENFNQDSAYRVLSVVDGDTIKVEYKGRSESVRLIGVDTPETVHPNKPVEAFGKEASAFTRNLLIGETVYLRFDNETRGKYNRLLAYVFRAPDGLFVNLEIVRQGYGHAYVKYPFKHMELFRHYEARARHSHKGLWNAKFLASSPGSQSQVSSQDVDNPSDHTELFPRNETPLRDVLNGIRSATPSVSTLELDSDVAAKFIADNEITVFVTKSGKNITRKVVNGETSLCPCRRLANAIRHVSAAAHPNERDKMDRNYAQEPGS